MVRGATLAGRRVLVVLVGMPYSLLPGGHLQVARTPGL
jgi:hypothetical protein